MNKTKKQILVLGGGLTGLSAGYVLTRENFPVRVFEGESEVGGLSRTIRRGGFRFDLGGHRFITKDREIERFVRDLMEGELLSVARSSKIYMRNRYFDYPLKPLNAMFGLGIPTTLKIMADYGIERLKRGYHESPAVSLEDWVVRNFGRTMFDIYFREYSEKVWGIDCSQISAEWVAQRIRGLSLSKAVRNAFFRFSGKDIPTLADSFIYPRLGIGRIAERLREGIEKGGEVHTGTRVERIYHRNSRIEGVAVRNSEYSGTIRGEEFISSMPVTHLVRMLHPSPPAHILNAASRLKFRDIVIVTIMVNRKRVTDQTWIYIPEKKIPFGRLHEPTNWSKHMAPEGKTLIVTEFFSFKGDRVWNEQDDRLAEITIEHLERLGFIRRDEVLDSAVVRAPKAYPLFEIGYESLCDELHAYLGQFENLHVAGRVGMFRYYNMDHAIRSGLDAAGRIMKRGPLPQDGNEQELVMAGSEACDAH